MSAAAFRPDRCILQRQKFEDAHAKSMKAVKDDCNLKSCAVWENKTAGTIRQNRINNEVSALIKERRVDALEARRKKLSVLLHGEQKTYEAELMQKTKPNPDKMKQKMIARAMDLKGRRESERERFVHEKLYQQWRQSIDELRQQDAKLFELQVTHELCLQEEEKDDRQREEAREQAMYDALWQEGYHAKVEREMREAEVRGKLTGQVTQTLGAQIALKKRIEDEEAADEAIERAEMKEQWANAETEAEELKEREAAMAKAERKKVDAFRAVVEAEEKAQADLEKKQDRQYVLSVLKNERDLAIKEENDRKRAVEKVKEFTECMKKDMARKAESEDELIRLQNEEQERQWEKRFAGWEAEELARRRLLEDVYEGRAEQIAHKNEVRKQQRQAILDERGRVEAENARVAKIDQERAKAEALLKKRHQEELFRQMDFHQVQRHRELQQHMIEQRQAMIAEERFRQAKESEFEKQDLVRKEIQEFGEKRKAEMEARMAAKRAGQAM